MGACICGKWKLSFPLVAIASQVCREGPTGFEWGPAQFFSEEFGPASVLQAMIHPWSRGRTVEEGRRRGSMGEGLEKAVGGRVEREAA